jgi:hypothetical protein
MNRCRSWRHRAAGMIYQAYPDNELLPIDPPKPRETIRAFARRAQEAGDTLFLFLCREATDDISAAEYVARLDRAINDIEQVRAAFARTGCATYPQKGGRRRVPPRRK